jgi:hypothetical protein
MVRSKRFTAAFIGSFALAAAAGCDAAGDGTAATTRDSAGVHIVESSAPAWSDADAWRVGPEPDLSVGSTGAAAATSTPAAGTEAAYLFEGVLSAFPLGEDRIVVADRRTSELRFFDADGRHVITAGREGEGPGEFRFMSLVWPLADDTVVVGDFRGLHLFDAAGVYRRSFSLVSGDGVPRAQAVAQAASGVLLATSGGGPPRPGEARMIRDTMRFHRFSATGSYLGELTASPSSAGVSGCCRHGSSICQGDGSPTRRRVPGFRELQLMPCDRVHSM